MFRSETYCLQVHCPKLSHLPHGDPEWLRTRPIRACGCADATMTMPGITSAQVTDALPGGRHVAASSTT